jgi:hypothetical protein
VLKGRGRGSLGGRINGEVVDGFVRWFGKGRGGGILGGSIDVASVLAG